MKYPAETKKQLINAMISAMGDETIKDKDCGLVFCDGKLYIAKDIMFKSACQNGVMVFGGFKEK